MLFRFAEKYLLFFNDHRDLFFIIMKEVNRMILGDDEESLLFVTRNRDRVANVLLPYLESAVTSGEVGAYPPRFLAHMILGNAHVYMMMMMHQSRGLHRTVVPTDTHEAASLITDVLVNGISGKRSTSEC